MVIDEKRISAQRNGCCPCIRSSQKVVESSVKENSESLSIMSKGFRLYGKMLKFKPVKILIILITVVTTSLGAYGTIS
ncbi:Uncharacterized protein FKW44_006484 [Caligus rogercresseyi]|uniref:Uncharacterized protein n=1 Tax=Caligus rogercresseyi TaxID=217165 RepID=A0A7T8QSX2_CALRO|nr:Uncharacterized protein FKW44_006484 [Caligus rogercresseyi]